MELTKQLFEEKISNLESEFSFKGDKPVVIDFYTDWCGPCKMLSPVVEELEKEYDGKIDFYKVNVEQEQELAEAFGVQSIPTLIFISTKGEIGTSMGFMPKPSIKDILNQQFGV